MARLLAAVLAAAFLAGCETDDGEHSIEAAPFAVTGSTASVIAGDMASRLVEQIGPGGATTIKMQSDSSDYATALESALKGWGYTVTVDGKVVQGRQAIEVAYSIDSFDGRILAQLSTSTVSLGRAYTPTTGGAMPSSPLSIMRRT
ncbi:hypothetical protein N185_17455 [Sinorhizobium sp. GW3]|nr:hypothetical protein N185_17455 [Sinorhizobium sp. GW3]